ncbi:MAG TPA: response regulator [Burkholderiaceae bacterium]|jgi:two-component system chemotaxis response regulator CheY
MLKVVIIDGSAITRGLLNTVLTDGGHEVVGDANTSPAGLARMIKLQPNVVCVDIGQEDDRLSILDTLRAGLPRAIIFLVSGKIEPDLVEQAVQHGVQGFIVKPFNSLTVLKTIRSSILKFVKKQQTLASVQVNAESVQEDAPK